MSKLPKYHPRFIEHFFPLTLLFATTVQPPHPIKISTLVSQAAEAGAQCPSHDGKIKTVPGHKDKVQSSRKSPVNDESKGGQANLRKVGLVMKMRLVFRRVFLMNCFCKKTRRNWWLNKTDLFLNLASQIGAFAPSRGQKLKKKLYLTTTAG